MSTKVTRYFYDFEFLEDGVTIDPISLGIVAEDGREYYAEFSTAPLTKMEWHQWIMANVVPGLSSISIVDPGVPARLEIDLTDPVCRSRAGVRADVFEFLTEGVGKPSLWGYYSAYDHVALAQLWGPMVDMPRAIPFYTNDIQTLWKMAGEPKKPENTDAHNALADARWNAKLFQICADELINLTIDSTSPAIP